MISAIILYISLFFFTSNGINADSNLRIAFLPFGKLTNQFLTTVQPKNALNIFKKYIYEFIDNSSNSTNVLTIVNDNWRIYVGYLVLVTIGIIFIVFFTLVGFCLCCCRCCCKKCGAKPPKQSERQTKRKRTILNVFLFLLTTLIFIGALVSMASNVILLEAFKPFNDSSDKSGNIIGNVENTIDQAISYINYLANNGLSNAPIVISNTTQSILPILLDSIGLFTKTFQDRLDTWTMFNNIDSIISGYGNVTADSRNLSTIAALHANKSKSFYAYLNSVNQKISTVLNNTECKSFPAQCTRINEVLPSLKIGYDYNKINYSADVALQNVFQEFNISEFSNGRTNVTNMIANIFSEINSTFTSYIQNFTNSLNSSSDLVNMINGTIAKKDDLITTLRSIIQTVYMVKIGNGTIYSYYKYVFYGFIFLIGIILLIVALIYLGLSFGVIGKPNYEKSSYCNRGVGSRFLMGGVALSFIFGWLLMLIATVMFVTGGLIQTEGCRYLTVGPDSTTLETVDEIINTGLRKLNISFDLNGVIMSIPRIDIMQSVLNRCPASTDLISALQIPTDYFNPISDYIFRKFISPYLATMTQKISEYNMSTINVDTIKSNCDKIIRILSNITAINFSATIDELKKPVTNMTDISGFISMIYNLSVISSRDFPAFSQDLNTTILGLNESVSEMTVIQESYLFQRLNFNNSIDRLDILVNNLNRLLQNLTMNVNTAKNTAANVTNLSLGISTNSLINQTILNIIKTLGNCRDLATTVTSAIAIICTTFLIPFNNIWMGIGWFLLFIIPVVVIGLKLNGLYRISKVEPGDSHHNKAYQGSNHLLTARDMELIRMQRPKKA